jgi:eukaryotic-like serine/threonine-protein kinase
MTLPAGTRLGPYEIVAPLGAGGMGEVYRARDSRLGRSVAVKVLPERLVEDPEALSRFEREAKAIAALSHPNILALHDVGREGRVAYAVMELLEGETLREELMSGAIAPRRAVGYGVQIANGLAAAHEKGIVHRDLKPDNLFVTRDDRVKVLDFGLAKPGAAPSEATSKTQSPTVSGYTEPGTVMGTVGYMSPEQVRGLVVDHRSDIFSLGAVLYEMLTGLPPFDADDLNAILYKVMNETPLPPTVRNRSIPSAFDHIVARALAKSPEDRYQTAEEMASDLRELRGIESPRANLGDSPPGTPVRQAPGIAGTLGSWRRRNLLLIGVPAALIVMVGAWGLARKLAPKREESAAKIASPSEASLVAAPPGKPVEPEAPVETVPPPAAAAVSESHPPKPMGRLVFAVTPWGVIYVDGIRKGVSPPLTEIKLAPGKHVVEIRNTTFRSYRQSVNLRGERTVKIKHKFK